MLPVPPKPTNAGKSPWRHLNFGDCPSDIADFGDVEAGKTSNRADNGDAGACRMPRRATPWAFPGRMQQELRHLFYAPTVARYCP